MSYKGTYEGKSLKHYRTKGSRNGYTKYPGKYTPIGEKAKVARQLLGSAANPNSMMSQLSNFRSKNNRIPTSVGANSPARPDDYAERRQAQEAWAQRMSNMQNNAMAGVRSKKPTSIPSFKRGDYQTAQAQAMERRRAAEAKVSTAAGAKNQAYQNAMANRSARNVGNISSTTKGQPNKGDYGKPKSQQQLVEERRIKGASLSRDNRQAAENRRIAGSAMPKTESYYQKQTENRRIAGSGMTASQIAAKNNQSAAEQRRISGSKLITPADANRMNAERRRIAGAKDAAATKALASVERRKSAGVSNLRNSRTDVENAIYDAKADAKRLIKKGRKKVRNLLRKFF